MRFLFSGDDSLRARAAVSVSPLLPLLAVVAVYLGYGKLFFMAALAALLHECGHLLAAFFFNVNVQSIRFSLFGAEIMLSPCSRGREAVIAASGIALNLLFAALFWMPWRLFAVLHLILAAFNALPVYPLDGGRLLRLLLAEERKTQIVSLTFCALLLIAAFLLSIISSDWLPFFAASVLCARAMLETIAFFRAVG